MKEILKEAAALVERTKKEKRRRKNDRKGRC